MNIPELVRSGRFCADRLGSIEKTWVGDRTVGVVDPAGDRIAITAGAAASPPGRIVPRWWRN